MYLFSRRSIATLGREFDALAAAVSVAQHVTTVTGRPVNVFSAVFGAPQGSVMWSTRAASFSDLAAITETLMADTTYLDMLDAMDGLFMAPAEDQFSRFMTTPLEAATSKYYGVTRAAMATGRHADAVAFGVRTAEYMGSSLGFPSAFTTAMYGGFGDVSWIVGFDSASDVDAFEAWQLSDSGYQEILAEAGALFVENSGHNTLIERVG
jgi:hypothetical protein